MIQRKIKLDETKTKGISEYFFKDSKLDEQLIGQFMREYVVDFCLCNYDATFRNFIVDMNGNLRGIDKEQSFKYIRNESEEDQNIDDFISAIISEPQAYFDGKLIECNKGLMAGVPIAGFLANLYLEA